MSACSDERFARRGRIGTVEFDAAVGRVARYGVDELQAIGGMLQSASVAAPTRRAVRTIRQNWAPLRPPAEPSGSIRVRPAIGRVAARMSTDLIHRILAAVPNTSWTLGRRTDTVHMAGNFSSGTDRRKWGIFNWLILTP